MFNKLLMVTTALLFASVLNAETYSCNVNIEEGQIKNVTTPAGTFVKNAVTFDTEENDFNTLVIEQGTFVYNFLFTVTTNHQISIKDYSNNLSCETSETYMSSGILMKALCNQSTEKDKKVFSADCQEIHLMK